jgi:NADH-quinone oxidoreductase subunit N
LVLVGLLFKVASVPFHMWMPDVYEGAPVTVTGFMTTGLKAAAFATLVRVYMTLGLDGSVAGGLGGGFSQSIFHALQSHVHHALWVSAALTMALGNFVALTQTNLKRMLAYSSIAHSGYLLMGIVSASHSELGYAPILLYLVVYSMMNLGAFTILSLIASRGDSGLNLHDLSGLARRHPWMAFSMSVFLFSMSGIPPTAGFMSKYYLFYSAVQAGEIPLVVIGVICSAVSVYYYLRVVVYMYMREPIGSPAEVRISIWPGFALLAMVVMVISIGILPSHLVDVARHVFEVM